MLISIDENIFKMKIQELIGNNRVGVSQYVSAETDRTTYIDIERLVRDKMADELANHISTKAVIEKTYDSVLETYKFSGSVVVLSELQLKILVDDIIKYAKEPF